MSTKLILILEDNEDRIRNFENTVASLGENFSMKIWNDAPTMITELPSKLNQACLVSLDHDLNPQPNVTTDPGTGLEVAEFLAIGNDWIQCLWLPKVKSLLNIV